MAEWDGIMSANKGIVILGATNRPFDLDDAILRRLPRRILIDLPTQEQRLLILQVHLKGENLASDIKLEDLAKQTASYSGSDLKNLCVAAALLRIKEAIYRTESSESLDLDQVSKKLDDLDDWNTILVSKKSEPLSTPLSPLSMRHFEKALKEVPPSLTDEMQTLIELRKWNKQFGENSAFSSKKQGWGF
jgi:SpoVK/Ycf46/Vps4 family AAA+-type ATPase